MNYELLVQSNQVFLTNYYFLMSKKFQIRSYHFLLQRNGKKTPVSTVLEIQEIFKSSPKF